LGQHRIEELHIRLTGLHLLSIDYQVCATYAAVKSQLRAAGRILTDNDLWIAAFALRHSVPLVSNNRRHFERISGLTLISEAPRS